MAFVWVLTKEAIICLWVASRADGGGAGSRVGARTDPAGCRSLNDHKLCWVAWNPRMVPGPGAGSVLGRCRRWRSNPSGKCSQERLTRGTVASTMRRAAHPSGCARCGAGAGCSAIKYQSIGGEQREEAGEDGLLLRRSGGGRDPRGRIWRGREGSSPRPASCAQRGEESRRGTHSLPAGEAFPPRARGVGIRRWREEARVNLSLYVFVRILSSTTSIYYVPVF